MENINELLEDLEYYFDIRADADHDGESFVPNQEMKLLYRIRELKQDTEPIYERETAKEISDKVLNTLNIITNEYKLKNNIP